MSYPSDYYQQSPHSAAALPGAGHISSSPPTFEHTPLYVERRQPPASHSQRSTRPTRPTRPPISISSAKISPSSAELIHGPSSGHRDAGTGATVPGLDIGVGPLSGSGAAHLPPVDSRVHVEHGSGHGHDAHTDAHRHYVEDSGVFYPPPTRVEPETGHHIAGAGYYHQQFAGPSATGVGSVVPKQQPQHGYEIHSPPAAYSVSPPQTGPSQVTLTSPEAAYYSGGGGHGQGAQGYHLDGSGRAPYGQHLADGSGYGHAPVGVSATSGLRSAAIRSAIGGDSAIARGAPVDAHYFSPPLAGYQSVAGGGAPVSGLMAPTSAAGIGIEVAAISPDIPSPAFQPHFAASAAAQPSATGTMVTPSMAYASEFLPTAIAPGPEVGAASGHPAYDRRPYEPVVHIATGFHDPGFIPPTTKSKPASATAAAPSAARSYGRKAAAPRVIEAKPVTVESTEVSAAYRPPHGRSPMEQTSASASGGTPTTGASAAFASSKYKGRADMNLNWRRGVDASAGASKPSKFLPKAERQRWARDRRDTGTVVAAAKKTTHVLEIEETSHVHLESVYDGTKAAVTVSGSGTHFEEEESESGSSSPAPRMAAPAPVKGSRPPISSSVSTSVSVTLTPTRPTTVDDTKHPPVSGFPVRRTAVSMPETPTSSCESGSSAHSARQRHAAYGVGPRRIGGGQVEDGGYTAAAPKHLSKPPVAHAPRGGSGMQWQPKTRPPLMPAVVEFVHEETRDKVVDEHFDKVEEEELSSETRVVSAERVVAEPASDASAAAVTEKELNAKVREMIATRKKLSFLDRLPLKGDIISLRRRQRASDGSKAAGDSGDAADARLGSEETARVLHVRYDGIATLEYIDLEDSNRHGFIENVNLFPSVVDESRHHRGGGRKHGRQKGGRRTDDSIVHYEVVESAFDKCVDFKPIPRVGDVIEIRWTDGVVDTVEVTDTGAVLITEDSDPDLSAFMEPFDAINHYRKWELLRVEIVYKTGNQAGGEEPADIDTLDFHPCNDSERQIAYWQTIETMPPFLVVEAEVYKQQMAEGMCMICCCTLSEFPYQAITPCGHDDICGKCALRTRWFDCDYRTDASQPPPKCPMCKENWDFIAIVRAGNPSLNWDSLFEYPLELDEEIRTWFQDLHTMSYFRHLRSFYCPICESDKESSTDFRKVAHLMFHLRDCHKPRQMCRLCLENTHMFVDEQRVFPTFEDLKNHDRSGSQMFDKYPKTEAHPFCSLCRKRFYDRESLFKHCEKDHFSCHRCQMTGAKANLEYYGTRKVLLAHLRKEHHLCEHTSCMSLGDFIVFDDLFQLETHEIAFHGRVGAGRDMSGGGALGGKRTIKVGFEYEEPEFERFASGARGDRRDEEQTMIIEVEGAEMRERTEAEAHLLQRQWKDEFHRAQVSHFGPQSHHRSAMIAREHSRRIGLRPIPDACPESEYESRNASTLERIRQVLISQSNLNAFNGLAAGVIAKKLSPSKYFAAFKGLFGRLCAQRVWEEILLGMLSLLDDYQLRRQIYNEYRTFKMSGKTSVELHRIEEAQRKRALRTRRPSMAARLKGAVPQTQTVGRTAIASTTKAARTGPFVIGSTLRSAATAPTMAARMAARQKTAAATGVTPTRAPGSWGGRYTAKPSHTDAYAFPPLESSPPTATAATVSKMPVFDDSSVTVTIKQKKETKKEAKKRRKEQRRKERKVAEKLQQQKAAAQSRVAAQKLKTMGSDAVAIAPVSATAIMATAPSSKKTSAVSSVVETKREEKRPVSLPKKATGTGVSAQKPVSTTPKQAQKKQPKKGKRKSKRSKTTVLAVTGLFATAPTPPPPSAAAPARMRGPPPGRVPMAGQRPAVLATARMGPMGGIVPAAPRRRRQRMATVVASAALRQPRPSAVPMTATAAKKLKKAQRAKLLKKKMKPPPPTSTSAFARALWPTLPKSETKTKSVSIVGAAKKKKKSAAMVAAAAAEKAGGNKSANKLEETKEFEESEDELGDLRVDDSKLIAESMGLSTEVTSISTIGETAPYIPPVKDMSDWIPEKPIVASDDSLMPHMRSGTFMASNPWAVAKAKKKQKRDARGGGHSMTAIMAKDKVAVAKQQLEDAKLKEEKVRKKEERKAKKARAKQKEDAKKQQLEGKKVRKVASPSSRSSAAASGGGVAPAPQGVARQLAKEQMAFFKSDKEALSELQKALRAVASQRPAKAHLKKFSFMRQLLTSLFAKLQSGSLSKKGRLLSEVPSKASYAPLHVLHSGFRHVIFKVAHDYCWVRAPTDVRPLIKVRGDGITMPKATYVWHSGGLRSLLSATVLSALPAVGLSAVAAIVKLQQSAGGELDDSRMAALIKAAVSTLAVDECYSLALFVWVVSCNRLPPAPFSLTKPMATRIRGNPKAIAAKATAKPRPKAATKPQITRSPFAAAATGKGGAPKRSAVRPKKGRKSKKSKGQLLFTIGL